MQYFVYQTCCFISFQTGGDGCVCYFEYDQGPKIFEFVGMKHLKELSLVQNVWSDKESPEDLANCGYAIGFASTEFIIWNFKTEAKVIVSSNPLSP